jgi:GT2 family glycosyltransferase
VAAAVLGAFPRIEAGMMAPVSVVIPTYGRFAQLAGTLHRLMACSPPPAEILVHVDHGDGETEEGLRRDFPRVRLFTSDRRMGPGGGRNKLVEAAANDIVASFDDDSYPLDGDYFSRLLESFAARPDAAVIASRIFHRGEPVEEGRREIGLTVHFVGCGVAYRRGEYLATGGYVPLAVAYGMEEVDLGLRLTDARRPIYLSNWLRVFHDTDLAHHASARVTSGSIANIALLVFLRYPPSYWPYGFLQLANRVAWLLRVRRFAGIGSGLARIPGHLWEHRALRRPVSRPGLARFLRMRRHPAPLEPVGA